MRSQCDFYAIECLGRDVKFALFFVGGVLAVGGILSLAFGPQYVIKFFKRRYRELVNSSPFRQNFIWITLTIGIVASLVAGALRFVHVGHSHLITLEFAGQSLEASFLAKNGDGYLVERIVDGSARFEILTYQNVSSIDLSAKLVR